MLSTALPMLFGLAGDRTLKHVSEVKKGKDCKCRCPKCGASLVAKKGRRNRHHFAHSFVAECPGGAETALHLFAKQLLMETKRLRLPAVRCYGEDQDYQSSKVFIAKKAEAEFFSAEGRLRSDVLLTTSTNKQLAVEISVAHPTDNFKIRKLIRSGQETLEINCLAIFKELLKMHERLPTLEELKIAIIYGKKHKKWLFHLQQHRNEYRRRKQATIRTIRTISRPNYSSQLVRNCPDRERQRTKITQNYRYTYARLNNDCQRCPHRIEVQYDYEWVGFQRIPVRPVRLLCGHP